MPGLFTTALHVTTPIGLTALVVAAVIGVIDRNLKSKSKQTQQFLRYAFSGCLIVVVFALLGEFYLRHEAAANSVYRVRVTILGGNNLPLENAKVWSSIGGEPKAVAGGFEFDIPFASKPADGQVVFFASVDNDHAQGKTTLTLGDDRFPSTSVNLLAVQTAVVRGTVEDDVGHAIGGVHVSVAGFGEEHVITPSGGSFVLPAHAADGQTVRLHAEAKFYAPLDQDQPAGNFPVIIVLHRDHAHQ